MLFVLRGLHPIDGIGPGKRSQFALVSSPVEAVDRATAGRTGKTRDREVLNGCLFVGPWRSSPCRLLDSEDAGEGGADQSSDHERGFGQEAETPGVQAEVEDPECEVA